jgi:hypothetical protein
MFISLVNLIIWLEKKTSITNKAKKKNTNNDLMKKNACQYHENISLEYS